MSVPKKTSGKRTITLWVMVDRTGRHYQYQVRVDRLKQAAAVLIVLPLVLLGSGVKLVTQRLENLALSRIAEQYYCSNQKLQELSAKLNDLENEVALHRGEARSLISALQKEIRLHLPEGAAGGTLDDPHPSPPLSPSQREMVLRLENRLADLEKKLAEQERGLSEIDRLWKERNQIFSATPSLWPLDGGIITSDFGMRIHPLSARLKMHEGIDIFTLEGEPIYAAAAGVVSFAGEKGGYGNCLHISHGYGITTVYAHCSRLLVRTGQIVKRGQVIGRVGNSGASTGPHLHFEVRILDKPVDPQNFVSLFSAP